MKLRPNKKLHANICVLADIISPLAMLNGYSVAHKCTVFGRTDIPDVVWIQSFGQNKDAAFLTCDTNILRKPLELATFRRTNITGFLLKTKSRKQCI